MQASWALRREIGEAVSLRGREVGWNRLKVLEMPGVVAKHELRVCQGRTARGHWNSGTRPGVTGSSMTLWECWGLDGSRFKAIESRLVVT